MAQNYYSSKFSENFLTFEFISEGPRGKIVKVVNYEEINIKGLYNLSFGDKDPISGFISDLTVTNNLDSQKVLSTVASTLDVFMSVYPDASVLVTGSTEARTRLYRMGITNNLENIEKNYMIYGLTTKGWEKFKKSIEYAAFLVQKKL